MSLLNVECKKCGSHFKYDIGEKSIDQVKAIWSKYPTFDCTAGHHVELSSPLNYLIIGEIEPGKAQTEKDWLKEQKKNMGKRPLMTKDQVEKKFICDGFSYGLYCGHNKKTNEKVVLDFITSPEGKRYYY